MEMNVPDMQAHIETLAKAHNITIEWRNLGGRGRAYRKKRLIKIPPIRSEVTYALALHELGHCISAGQRGRRLDCEMDAWHWARTHALIWTDGMEWKQTLSLRSYVQWARRRQQNDKQGRVFIIDDRVPQRYRVG